MMLDMVATKGEDLRQRLVRLRKERGLSQAALKRMSGCQSVAMIESGKRLDPRFSSLWKISQALGVTVNELSGHKAHEVDAELTRYLDSQAPKDITEEEIELLQGLSLKDRHLTTQSYALALLMIRSAEAQPLVVENDA